MGARHHLGRPLRHLVEIGQHVIAGKKEHRQTDILWRLALGDQKMGRVILVPGADAAARRGDEAVVVNDVAGRVDDRFGEGDDGLEVEEVQIGGTDLEHPVVERFAIAADALLVGEGAVEGGAATASPGGGLAVSFRPAQASAEPRVRELQKQARAAAAERATEDGAAATEDAAEVKKDEVGEVDVEIKNSKTMRSPIALIIKFAMRFITLKI